jgi:uncharacterized membrane protein
VDFVKFTVAVIAMGAGLYYSSLWWYRTRDEGWIATALRLSPIGLIGFPLASLALVLANEPHWLSIVGAPTSALLIVGSAYLGLRRAAKERADTIN